MLLPGSAGAAHNQTMTEAARAIVVGASRGFGLGIAEALERPKPRIKTRPSRGAREERVNTKTARGKVKKMRSRKVDFD